MDIKATEIEKKVNIQESPVHNIPTSSTHTQCTVDDNKPNLEISNT